jgi:hypothetical protein
MFIDMLHLPNFEEFNLESLYTGIIISVLAYKCGSTGVAGDSTVSDLQLFGVKSMFQ